MSKWYWVLLFNDEKEAREHWRLKDALDLVRFMLGSGEKDTVVISRKRIDEKENHNEKDGQEKSAD